MQEIDSGFRTDLKPLANLARSIPPRGKIVAEFFGVTEYEIRKAVKLAQLIPPLAEIVENEPKKLNLACADLITDYDAATQAAFIEMCPDRRLCAEQADNVVYSDAMSDRHQRISRQSTPHGGKSGQKAQRAAVPPKN